MLKKRRVIPHYTKDPEIECIDAIHAALGNEGFVAYCRGCILKYTWRYEHKGQRQEDAAKIQDYAFFAEQVCSEVQPDPVREHWWACLGTIGGSECKSRQCPCWCHVERGEPK